MKKKQPQNTSPESGIAMVGTLLVLLGITSLIVVGTLRNSDTSERSGSGSISEESGNEMAQVRRRGNYYQAQSLSESGIRMAIQWLVDQTTTPSNTTAFAPSSLTSFYGATTQSNNWSMLSLTLGPSGTQLSGAGQVTGEIWVKFYPYTSNATSGRKMFAIESEGRIGGRTYLSRIFVRQNTFAKFAYFSDVCPTSWWVTGLARFQGPVHINGVDGTGNAIDTAARMNIIWRIAGTQALRRLFTYTDTDYFTTAMPVSQLLFYRTDGNTTWSETPSDTSTNWDWITAANRPPLGNQPIIKPPVATTDQRTAALGTGTVPTDPVGVVIPGVGVPSAGIYVKGDVRDFNLSVGGANTTQVLSLVQYNPTTQKDVWTTITMDPVANTTALLVKERSNPTNTWDINTATGTWSTTTNTNYTGVPNGVVYVDGNIGEQTGLRRGGLSGVVANNIVTSGTLTRSWAMNIVTEQTKAININGGIVYQNLISNGSNTANYLSTAATADAVTSGTLGIIAGSMQIVDNDDNGNGLTNISVHGACMAYNTFNATNATTRAIGAFNLLGGYIVRVNGTFGTSLPNGTQENGFLINRNFDQRLAENPPPFFLSTERSYMIVSYQRAVTSLN